MAHNIKLIERDGKEFFGNFGGHLIEATTDNINAVLESQRRVLGSIEDLYQKHQKEVMRLENVKAFIFKKKFASGGLDE